MGIKTGSREIYQAMGSDDFFKNRNYRMGDIYWRFYKGEIRGNYTVYDTFYSAGAQPFDAIVLQSDKGYTFTYTSPARDSYVAVLEFAYSDNMTGALAIVYGRIDGTWKVCETEWVYLTKNGRTVQQMYAQAKKQQDNGFIIDALFDAQMALNIAGSYQDKNFGIEEIKLVRLLHAELKKACNEQYVYPHILEGVSSGPKITQLSTLQQNDNLIHYITYTTTVAIDDIPGLEKEAREMRKALPQYFKGINFKKQEVTFRAIGNSVDEYGNAHSGSHSFSYNKAQ